MVFINKESKSFAIYTNFIPSLDDKWLEVAQADYDEYVEKTSNDYDAEITIEGDTYKFTYTYNEERAKEEKLAQLRSKREPLLKAFDIYKTNVIYGILTESEEEHATMLTWYRAILDLNEDAINNVPEVIKQYL